MEVFVYISVDTMMMRMTVNNSVGVRCTIMCMNKDMRVFMGMALQERIVNDKPRPDDHDYQRKDVAWRQDLMKESKGQKRTYKRSKRVICACFGGS